MTTTSESAAGILEHIGGSANVTALQHCSTRLRFTVREDAKVDEHALMAVPGVIGVVADRRPRSSSGRRSPTSTARSRSCAVLRRGAMLPGSR